MKEVPIMANVARVIQQKDVLFMVQHLNTLVQHRQDVALTIQKILI
jgi:hypothetical protein